MSRGTPHTEKTLTMPSFMPKLGESVVVVGHYIELIDA